MIRIISLIKLGLERKLVSGNIHSYQYKSGKYLLNNMRERINLLKTKASLKFLQSFYTQ